MTDNEEHLAIIEHLRMYGYSAQQIANYLLTYHGVHVSVIHPAMPYLPREPLEPLTPLDDFIKFIREKPAPLPPPPKPKRKPPRRGKPKRVPERNWLDFLPGEVARPQAAWSKRNRILAAVRNGARKSEIAKFLRLSGPRIYEMYNRAVKQEEKLSPFECYLNAPPLLSKREHRSLQNYPLVSDAWEWEHLL